MPRCLSLEIRIVGRQVPKARFLSSAADSLDSMSAGCQPTCLDLPRLAFSACVDLCFCIYIYIHICMSCTDRGTI